MSVPASSKEAQFFQAVEPLTKGSLFEVEMQSRQFCQKKVFLSLNLMELHVGNSETLLLSKLLKTELTGQTLDLIKQHKLGAIKGACYSFCLLVS